MRAPGRLRSVGRHVTRWAADTVGVLIALSAGTFALVLLARGDPAAILAATRAGRSATPEQIEAVRTELGLDAPAAVRYLRWLAGASTGDFGLSLRTNTPVGPEIADRLGVTLGLVAGSAVVALVAGVAVGVAGAVLGRGLLRGVLRGGALLATSVPAFWLSYLLVLALALRLNLVPTSGMAGPATWVMPVAVLGLPAAGALSRVVAVTLREALDRPYVLAARARGSGPVSIVLRDGLPNAAGPILSVAGVMVGGLLVGTVVVEQIFGWPGLGAYFVHAAAARDVPALQAGTLILGGGFILANRLADVLQALIDPRSRRDAGRRDRPSRRTPRIRERAA
ncbi:peptide ABC transporter permease [Sphaerisporangium siamense]|uniref:ABC-type dipeptide/oligopeptide/nickel transport system permease component n=1 Tax=Sphaerisporangium siamense TaxID=795645 RepID=A0A7W7DBV1_9ACTN|nr:ABC transporter permease [Sphaerisporangium siamense]MBB4702786.1 ABC-type dipeptide/oligopeptide/nickel transport system permease component [Sphaerisporangium siamense]GII83460.1 peptide ABC transporter permease [Sphaerisporangium siamense]